MSAGEETTITIRFHEALDLPRAWAEDPIGQKEGSKKAGVPEDITLATQPQIALQQIRSLLQPGAPRHWVLADAGYGIDSAFRQGLTDRGLAYVVAITRAVVVWPPRRAPVQQPVLGPLGFVSGGVALDQGGGHSDAGQAAGAGRLAQGRAGGLALWRGGAPCGASAP
ncbi:transposase [Verminephrobacter eiseniae]|nr:transposase [Verminephrobacter eiseniae]MCW5292835.1 transposase [Verminephrobacter eiseniae]MCW8186200.1 transposase [Verminephrobacter eiseniae]MCW8224476.1 transposase [Verminephrobacter eiseniae]MCW8235554.1 transposase [Verminephrobacter eiseniae]